MRDLIVRFFQGSTPDILLGALAILLCALLAPSFVLTILLVVGGCVTILILLVTSLVLGRFLTNFIKERF